MYNIYENLHIFATKYRKYTILSDKLDQQTFKKKMQLEQYVTIEAEQMEIPIYHNANRNQSMNSDDSARPKHSITIALISPDSKFIKSAAECRTILIKLTKNDHDNMAQMFASTSDTSHTSKKTQTSRTLKKDVQASFKESSATSQTALIRSLYLVTRDDIKSLLAKTKSIVAWVTNIENYQHITFIMEIPRGPHCSKHEIMSIDEVKKELLSNYIDPDHIPLIADNDPQCIWIGACVGNIVRITRHSLNSGYSTEYRKVIPRTMTDEIKSTISSSSQHSGSTVSDE